MVDSKTGPRMKKTFVSISQAAPADVEDDNPEGQDNHTEHQGVSFDDMLMFNDEMNEMEEEPDDGVVPAAKTKKAQNDIISPSMFALIKIKQQSLFLQEFVNRVDGLMKALLERETCSGGNCAECGLHRARWRCRDCSLPEVLCRPCMRRVHRREPLHHIECWTGTYFRAAALWEVGSYMVIKHGTGTGICNTMQFQMQLLEEFQIQKDHDDQDVCQSLPPAAAGLPAESSMSAAANTAQQEMRRNELNKEMDPWYDEETPIERMGIDNILEEDEEDEEDDTLTSIAGFQQYLGENQSTAAAGEQCAASGQDFIYQDMPHDQDMPHVPRSDAFNNCYWRVVHINGIHHIGVITCNCRGNDQLPLDLMHARLVPSSFKNIRTVFTATLLDMYRMANLELKASAYQYFQLLRRLTAPTAIGSVPNLYHQLRLVSRAWRWMKKLKWSGFGHTTADPMSPATGQLANFCPACPQPDVNLPADWKDDPNRWVYRRFFVADGNFKADHVRQKRPAGDVWLSEGGGIMPRRDDYEAFLQRAIERQSKVPCESHFRAIEQAMLFSKACDITGIVAIACARHGCFAPNAVVNLFRGEQQKNVDYAFLQALKTTNVETSQGALLLYDIVCHYFIHFYERVGELLPAGLQVDRGIGLFHVHGHKDECFFRYSPFFIPGTGVVSGEILESLWAGMNTITPAMRTATLAHRAEMMDDHACDSNHKKLLGMGMKTPVHMI